MKHIREIMDNDCPTCEGRKMILTRDYADCEREETCPTCAAPAMWVAPIASKRPLDALTAAIKEQEG